MKSLFILALAIAAASALPTRQVQDAIVKYPHIIPRADKSFNHRFGRIYGGEAADITEFPFIAALLIDDLYFCGSSIVASDAMITAAHCVDGAQNLEITAGSTNWRVPSSDAQIRQVTNANFGRNSRWNCDDELSFDIGWIKMPAGSEWDLNGVNVDAVGVFIGDEPVRANVSVTEVGWGATRNSGSVSNTLNKATGLYTVSDAEAKIYFSDRNLRMYQFVCTFGNSNSPGGDWGEPGGSCGGDSGGPMILESNGMQIGATSFGNVQCEFGPGCYSELFYYYTYLEQMLDMDLNGDGAVATDSIEYPPESECPITG